MVHASCWVRRGIVFKDWAMGIHKICHMIDLVIVSNALDQDRKHITETAMLTASVDPMVGNIVVVEQQAHIYYNGAETVHYDFSFNYHKCLNLGIEYTDAEYIALCNNDLVFSFNWATKMLEGMNGYLSASPWSENVHGIFWGGVTYDPVGWDVRSIIAGWCIVIHESVLKKIGKLHEGVKFWYSDNVYAAQIKKAGIKHILVRESRVEHLETRTLAGHPLLSEYTGGQFENYQNVLNEINNL